MSRSASEIGRSNVGRSKSHERRIARLLTDWSGVPFRRRRVEGRDDAVRVVELVADVIPCLGDFHFSVEAKCGKGFSLDGLLANPTGSLFTGWWHQACYDAQLLSKDLKRTVYPMVFFKPHPNWDWVAFSCYAIGLLRPKEGSATESRLWFPHLIFNHFEQLGPVSGNVAHSKRNKKMMAVRLDPAVFCRWYDFETNVAPTSTFLTWPATSARKDEEEVVQNLSRPT